MSAVAEDKPYISANDLKTFTKGTREIVMQAVNEFGVSYRKIDGGHIRLYCGDRNVIPAKINDNSPEQHILRKLLPWLEAHVPGWSEREVKPETLTVLKEVMDSAPAERTEAEPPTDTQVSPEKAEWEPFRHGFETDGTTYRCTYPKCGYARDDAKGLHLHEAKHTGKSSEASAKAAESAKLRKQQERTLITQALTMLAEIHDVQLPTEDAKEIERLRAENERLKVERDEAKARLALIQETLRA